ncbi:MAG: glutamine--fructose-6-phosphate transaminase (isomerizing) [Proteobacteria bacterium]|nr:glutamine--fructose-6-phosphate transaminase (isomerizing) [Pseudomonadota bacterium]HQR05061.1 glutamine--fructose-6-phosphate transaminase (isomerizing) [Rhodocyclaceae bacterium]
MCGIVAAVAAQNIVPVLIEGLRKLEYRGYDSAGLALVNPGLQRIRALGRVSELAARAEGASAFIGVAHTRWATHGAPSERNAHPHVSGDLAIVHNGIIENFAEIKADLERRGYAFHSDTDTEVVAHLLRETLKETPDLLEALRLACNHLTGAYALAVVREGESRIVVARQGAPLLLGVGEKGHYAASDASALLQVTRDMVYLEDGDLAEISSAGWRVISSRGEPATRAISESSLSADAVELGAYRHYMQKEIFEQPEALGNTLEMLGGATRLSPNIFGSDAPERFAEIRSVLILACGTSYHAGLVARYWIEELARIPCTVEIASEYRYRVTVPDPSALVVTISQSGETADTLAAVKYAKAQGMEHTLTICNSPESALVRESALRFLTRAGPEIGVASTKAFTTQLTALAMLALALAQCSGKLDPEKEQRHLDALRHLPLAVHKVLALEPEIKVWAERFAGKDHALFLGRGHHYPVALEGALKLKEISYIHAEAYPAGELKHGPLALVDRDMPVIAVAPNDMLLEKLKSNLQEVRARGGELYVFADADSSVTESDGIHVLRLPEHYGLLSPVLHSVPLQLLAYHVALVKGTDVDKPRNLAKSVTVE